MVTTIALLVFYYSVKVVRKSDALCCVGSALLNTTNESLRKGNNTVQVGFLLYNHVLKPFKCMLHPHDPTDTEPQSSIKWSKEKWE